MSTRDDQSTSPEEEKEEEDQELEINGDVLDTILSHVPLLDLVSASHVSKPWRHAVVSSIRRHKNSPQPWLIVHTQSKRHPHATATVRAYDPRSQLWIKLRQSPIEYISALKSSHSNFLYMISNSKFAFSSDPMNRTWHHVGPPRVWRTDPIVARVGQFVVIAGGAHDFEEDPLAVEMYDTNTSVWCTCKSLPGNLKDSAALSFVSVAATDEKIFVTVKQSGLTHWFDPETKSWSDPIFLNPGPHVSNYNIGSYRDGFILVGLCQVNNVDRVKIWKICAEDFSMWDEICEMPLEYVEKLRGECFGNSIDIRVAGNVVYVYNPWETEEVVACELGCGGGESCEWWRVHNVVAREEMILNRMVLTCAEVGIEELRQAIQRHDQIVV